MVRVCTLFLSIVIYLHRSVHCRRRALAVPINYRDPVNSLSLCHVDVLEASNSRRADTQRRLKSQPMEALLTLGLGV